MKKIIFGLKKEMFLGFTALRTKLRFPWNPGKVAGLILSGLALGFIYDLFLDPFWNELTSNPYIRSKIISFYILIMIFTGSLIFFLFNNLGVSRNLSKRMISWINRAIIGITALLIVWNYFLPSLFFDVIPSHQYEKVRKLLFLSETIWIFLFGFSLFFVFSALDAVRSRKKNVKVNWKQRTVLSITAFVLSLFVLYPSVWINPSVKRVLFFGGIFSIILILGFGAFFVFRRTQEGN